MSLVGNLADLGLGDILQIISLSRKSGILQLTTPTDSGEIHLAQGRVIAATRRRSEETVGESLLTMDVITAQQFQDLLYFQKYNPDDPASQPPALWTKFGVDLEQVEAGMRKAIEALVFAMFEWDEGTFSFVLAEGPERKPPLSVAGKLFTVQTGINPQYLAIEGTRLQDERTRNDPFARFMGQDARPVLTARTNTEAESAELDASFSEYDGPPAPSVPASPAPAAPRLPPIPGVSPPPRPPAAAAAPAPAPPAAPAPAPPAAPAPAPPAGPAPSVATAAGPAVTLLVIDDDENFATQLVDGLGTPAHTAVSVVDGVAKLEQLRASGTRCVVIADLIIARSDRSGILGGIEVLEKVRALDRGLPVVMITDYDNADAQARARELGVTAFLSKPRRAQMKKDQVTEPMQHFIGAVREALAPLLRQAPAPAIATAEPAAPARPPDRPIREATGFDLGRELSDELGPEGPGDDAAAPFLALGALADASPEMQALKSMLAELNDPANKDTITLLVLRYAAEMLPRAALFLATKREVVGLGGFSSKGDSANFVQRVRGVRIPTEDESLFKLVIRFKAPYRGQMPDATLNQSFLRMLGAEAPSEVFAAPILSGNRVAAILYGDNLDAQAKLGNTQGLEIFLLQAGLAMERSLLERKLKEATKA